MMNSSEQLWLQLVDAERSFFAANRALLEARTALADQEADLDQLVARALANPAERATALRLLLAAPESVRRKTFPILVELAAVSHRDLQLVREVILSLDAAWVAQHVVPHIERILKGSPTEEEYRRFAELLERLDNPYLSTLLERAASSDEADIREIAADFGRANPRAS